MPTIADIYKSSPQDTHPANTFTLLWRKYSLGDMYFMDNWPLAPERQMVINDPVSSKPVCLEYLLNIDRTSDLGSSNSTNALASEASHI